MPAVLEKRKKHIARKFKRVSEFSRHAQIDVVDGVFVPTLTWPYTANVFDSLFHRYDLHFPGELELHLMVKSNAAFLNEYGTLGAKCVVLQFESSDFEDVALEKERYGISKLGVSVLSDTSLDAVYGAISAFKDKVDIIQIMTIDNVGRQGSEFDRDSVKRVKEAKRLFEGKEIAVDGGINESNILSLKEAGASRFAVGSYIFNSKDPESSFRALEKIVSS